MYVKVLDGRLWDSDVGHSAPLALEELAQLLLLSPLLRSFLPRLESPRSLLIHLRPGGHPICATSRGNQELADEMITRARVLKDGMRSGAEWV